MDEAGVHRALLVPTSSEGDRNDTCLAAAARFPARFGVMGRIDLTKPSEAEAVKRWRSTPGMIGIRLTLRQGPATRWLDDGTADWFWPVAQQAGVPVFVLAPGLLDRVHVVAARFDGLRIAVDHFGLMGTTSPSEVSDVVEGLIRLSQLPNVAVKASALPTLASDSYPFRSLHETVKRVVDAFGAERVFWGSDLTRLRCTYRESIAMFADALDFLGEEERELILGRAVEQWLGWSDPSERPD
jgi:predicted TIM-barrel fold metal-dependent hydrolase